MEKKAKISIDQNRNHISGFGGLGVLNIAKHHKHFTDFNKLFTQYQGGGKVRYCLDTLSVNFLKSLFARGNFKFDVDERYRD